jgi:hypothetical protein
VIVQKPKRIVAGDPRRDADIRAVVTVEHVNDAELAGRLRRWIDRLVATHGGK